MTLVGWKLSPWLLIALAAGYVICFWFDPIGDAIWSPLGRNMLHNDSPGYIRFWSERSAGYPVFLNLITIVFGSVQVAPKVQLVLLAVAVSFLGWSVYRTFSAPYFAPTMVLVLFGLSAVSKFHAYILSEALFISLLCTMMGCLIMLVAYPTVRLAAVAALTCGLAITVRPAGLSLLAIWPPLIWFIWGRCAGKRWRLVAAVAAPLVLCYVTESAIWHRVHGGDRTDRPHRVDYHLFGAVLMMESEPSVQDDQLGAFVAEARRAWGPGRDLVRNAPDWQTRTLLARYFEVAGHYVASRGNPSFRGRIKQLAEQRETSVHRLLGYVGWSALLAAPEEWATNAWLHYRGLWAHHSIYGMNFIRRYAAYTEGQDVTAPIRMPPGFHVLPPRGPLPLMAAFLNRLATVAAFLASALVVGLAVWQRLGKVSQEPLLGRRVGSASRMKSPDDDLVAAAMAAIVVHGYFLATAMFAATNLRYSATMWTFEALYSLLLVRWALRFWNLCSRAAEALLTRIAARCQYHRNYARRTRVFSAEAPTTRRGSKESSKKECSGPVRGESRGMVS